jgi:hypothetical protein
MPDTVIGQHHPRDGQEWDCQCARCGSSLTWDDCEACGGEGVSGHDCGEDCCCFLDPEDSVSCGYCRGEGGFYHCLSSHAWCQAHPRPGREKVESGTPEWFVVGPRKTRIVT